MATVRVVNNKLGFIYFLFFYFNFIFSILFYFRFSLLLFFILDLDKECNVMLHIIVTQVIKYDKDMI